MAKRYTLFSAPPMKLQSPIHKAALAALAACAALLVANPAIGQKKQSSAKATLKVGDVLAAQLIEQGDANRDALLSKEEWTAISHAWFETLDPDGAGRIGQEEFLRRFKSVSQSAQMNATRSLRFFTVVDTDSNTILEKGELLQAFDRWFVQWTANNAGAITQETIATRLQALMPLNNFSGATGLEAHVRLPGLPPTPPAPILPPEKAIETIRVEKGFHLERAANEPLIQDPIALSFDEDGRLFVLEMRSYQLDIDRGNERDPISRISLLEDSDHDGVFDTSTVFVDGLILPRALLAVRGGLMYVSDYQLYFSKDTNGDGKADVTTLLDAEYGGGNVEHAPNGLMLAMDNWIYNAKSDTRYRWIRDTLVKQKTENRGQWGITQDNYGRLLYNINNSQLLGDFTPPNYMGRNENYPTSAGLNLFVATDQRVFSARMNTGVNRGYLRDVLDPSGKLYVFASSCSPLVYRGDNFPPDFVGNAFVADPAANLIKRNLMFDDGLTLSSKFAYDDREFIASTDERFRPVNLYNGPDGTLWVVDLYRGIAQYSQFMTQYLRKEALSRDLDKGIHLGRIYRVVSDKKAPTVPPKLSTESSAQLIKRLSHANGWIRDTAQRLLIERGDPSAIPLLLKLVSENAKLLARIHALWTIEGLLVSIPSNNDHALQTIAEMVPVFDSPALSPNVVEGILEAIYDSHPKVQVAALRVAESLTAADPKQSSSLFNVIAELPPSSEDEVLFQAVLTAGNLAKPEILPVLAQLASRSADQLLMREAVLSGLQNWELQFLQTVLLDPEWLQQKPGRTAFLESLASAIAAEKQPSKMELLLTLIARQSSEQKWRQRALLGGLAAETRGKIGGRITFTREPPSLQTLVNSADLRTREQSEQIKVLFSWPGHNESSKDSDKAPGPALSASETTRVEEGKTIYQQICAGCHGANGEGLRPIAPPLVDSEWVTDSVDRLVRITLHGVQGAISVDGSLYEPPAILPEMPPLAALDDAQLASVLSYIRRDWGHSSSPVSVKQVQTIRAETADRAAPWTETELLEIEKIHPPL